MKNQYNLLVTAMLLSSPGFFSCTNEEQQSLIQHQNSWKDISSSSVKGVDYVSNYLEDKIVANGRMMNLQEATENIISATQEFLDSEGFSEEEKESAEEYLNIVLNADEKPYYDGEVTDMQASFIAALEIALQEGPEFESTIALLDTLELQAYELLNQDEIGLVMTSISTAKSQIIYWNQSNSAESNERSLCVKSWREVGVSATAGLFGGAAACGGGWLLGIGPVGWKALGACAIAGSIGVAVENIVEQCLSSNKATASNCQRYSGGNITTCGGFLNYKNRSYKKNPYRLLKYKLIKRFP